MGGHPAMPPPPRSAAGPGVAGKPPASAARLLQQAEKNGRPSGASRTRPSGKQRLMDAAAEGSNGLLKAATSTPESSPSQPPRQKRRKTSEDPLGSAQESAESDAGEAAASAAAPKRLRRAAVGGAAGGSAGWRRTADVDRAADEEGDAGSDSEEEALSALKAVVASETAVATGAIDGVVDWRRGLQELRRKRSAPSEAKGGEAAAAAVPDAAFANRHMSPDELLKLLRDAIRRREWCAVTGGHFPKPKDVAAAVKRLDLSEAVQVLKVCAERHEAHPKEQKVCSSWILEILGHGGEPLLIHKGAKRALRPLLAGLEQRLNSSGASGEALVCLGKWRYVAELAAGRRATLKVGREGGGPAEGAAKEPEQAKGASAAKAASTSGPADVEEESSDQDDEEEGGMSDGAGSDE